MFKRICLVSAAFLLTVAGFVAAQELKKDHPQTYTVVSGDTLWDIAGRFLTKPWLWPEIWQANPHIENPHRIYPGDQISLAYLDGKPVIRTTPGAQPEVRSEPGISAINLQDIEPFLRELSVLNEIKSLPYVVGVEEGRLRSTAGQLIYVRGLSGAQVGDEYSVVRPTEDFSSSNDRRLNTLRDTLNDRGNTAIGWTMPWSRLGKKKGKTDLGIEVHHQTRARVTRTGGDISTLVLVDENREAREGDRLSPADNNPYDAEYFPHAPAAIGENARIIAVTDQSLFGGARSVVALSVGSADGIDNGTVFSIWSPGEEKSDRIANGMPIMANFDKVQLPDEYAAHVLVFRTFDKVSYGLVMESIRPVDIGDLIKHPDATD